MVVLAAMWFDIRPKGPKLRVHDMQMMCVEVVASAVSMCTTDSVLKHHHSMERCRSHYLENVYRTFRSSWTHHYQSFLPVPSAFDRAKDAAECALQQFSSSLPTVCVDSSPNIDSYPAPGQFLYLTAVTAHNGNSVLECWQTGPLLVVPSGVGFSQGRSTDSGPGGNASWTIVLPHYDVGLHFAPAKQ